MRTIRQFLLCAATVLVMGHFSIVHAVIVGPYSADSNTLFLWQFDEANNTSASTAAAVGSVSLEKGNNATLGNASFAGFGNAGNTSADDNSEFLSASTHAVSTVTSANGAFTFEALINTSVTSDTQQIFTMDNDAGGTNGRPFQFRVDSGNLEFVYINNAPVAYSAAIPTAGAHAFVADEWFHVAVTYNGDEGTADNLKLYWTRVDASHTQANEIGSLNMVADLDGSDAARYGGGNFGRTNGTQDNNLEGLIDEVRISNVARGADEFIFAIPEPASLILLGAGCLFVVGRRR